MRVNNDAEISGFVRKAVRDYFKYTNDIIGLLNSFHIITLQLLTKYILSTACLNIYL